MLGTNWFLFTFIAFVGVSYVADYDVIQMVVGWRAAIALTGYLIMQIGKILLDLQSSLTCVGCKGSGMPRTNGSKKVQLRTWKLQVNQLHVLPWHVSLPRSPARALLCGSFSAAHTDTPAVSRSDFHMLSLWISLAL